MCVCGRSASARCAECSPGTRVRAYELAVRDVVHGRAVRNKEALANPEALDLYRDLPQLAR